MIHLDHFGLTEDPFGLTPDPRFLYLGDQYQMVLGELGYGVAQRKGFMVLTGEVGTGKTTLCRSLLEGLGPGVRTALVLNPVLHPRELLQVLLEDFGLPSPGPEASKKEMVDLLNGFLLQVALGGGTAVAIVDEAQNLSLDLLEELRLLSNLETDREKLLQILLVGQPELSLLLDNHGLRQVRQRVAIWTHLGPLPRGEVGKYLAHRLSVASGGGSNVRFTGGAVRALDRASGGYPRATNLLADRALLGAFAEGKARVDRGMVRRAHREVREGTGGGGRRWIPVPALAGVVLLALLPGGFSPHPALPGGKGGRTGAFAVEGPSQALSRFFRRTGQEFLAGEALLWHIEGARPRDLETALEALGMPGQYGMVAAVIPLDLVRWRAWEASGLVRLRGGGFALLSPSPGGGEEWLLEEGEKGSETIPAGDLSGRVDDPGALVLFRPLPGLEGPLAPGMTGAPVYALEAALSRLGRLGGGPAGGVFGPRMEAAMSALQKEWGLPVTGILDDRTGFVLARLLKGRKE